MTRGNNIFGMFRSSDSLAPPPRRPTTFLSDTFNVSPSPITSESRTPSPNPAHSRFSGGFNLEERIKRRSSILGVIDSIAGTRFRKSSVASSVATSASIVSSRSIRTLKDVKDELQMQEPMSGRKRKGSIADLHDSVQATGIAIRESFGPEPFKDHPSVLTVDEEDYPGEGDDEGMERKQRKYHIIRGSRPLSKLMDILMIVIALWSIGWVPLSVAFHDFLDIHPFWAVLDFIFSAAYCIGVILSFFTSKPNFAYVKEVVLLSEIRSHIFRTPSFYLDLITLVPWMTIAPKSSIRWILLLRGHRLCRTPASWEENVRCSAITGLSDFIAIFRVILWFFLLSHCLGCIWFACQDDVSRLRHVSNVPEEERSPLTFYLQAFRDGAYMLMTRDRPAYTDLEVAVVGCMGPSGAFFIIWMTGHFAVLLQRLQALTSKNFAELSLIRAAMNRQRLPKELQFRVLRFHYYSYLQHDEMAYQVLFRSLSTPLTCEIKFWIFRKLIRYVPFFQEASPKAIKSIILALTLANYSPGDVIIRCGDYCSDMYFVIKGVAQVLDGNGLQPIKRLKAGEYFGELALQQKSTKRRTTWVRADTFCCLAELSSSCWDQIVAEFPEQRTLMLNQIKSVSDSRRCSAASYSDHLERIDENSPGSRRGSNASVVETPITQRIVAGKIDSILDHIRLMEGRLNNRLNTVEQCIRAEAPTARMTPYNVSSYQSRRESDSSHCDASVMSTPKRRSLSTQKPVVQASSTGRESLCIPHSIMTQTILEASAASTTRSSQATLNQSFSPKQLQDILSSRASSLLTPHGEGVDEYDAEKDDDDSGLSMVSDTLTEPRSHDGNFRVDEDLEKCHP